MLSCLLAVGQEDYRAKRLPYESSDSLVEASVDKLETHDVPPAFESVRSNSHSGEGLAIIRERLYLTLGKVEQHGLRNDAALAGSQFCFFSRGEVKLSSFAELSPVP
jgi:hypothetical protein